MTSLKTHLSKIFGTTCDDFVFPDFVVKKGIWVHNNQHAITVIRDNNELLEPTLEHFLLGVYKLDDEIKEGKFILFDDAIREVSKRYADHKSLFIKNGKIIGDLRNTRGAAITAEPTGLFETDAFEYIKIICKIELTLLDIIHCRFGEWQSKFYSDKNIRFIDFLVMQLTKIIIDDDSKLVDCFEWLNINGVSDTEFSFKTPVPFVEKISGITEQEWSLINHFYIYLINEIDSETWEAFFGRIKEIQQDSLIELEKKHGGWEIIEKSLTQEYLSKYRGKRSGKKFGF